MRKKVPSGEHPSIAAASSSSYGIPLIKPVKINTVIAPPNPQYANTIPGID